MRRTHRTNPLRYDLRYSKEDAARYGKSRAVRSIVSPALQASNVERMANSPHTFIVVVAGDRHLDVEGTPEAVTLGVSLETVLEIDEEVGGLKKTREGIYTAFTYLHKLGDVYQLKMLPGEALAQSLPDPEDRSEDRVFRPFYKMLDKHLDLLRDALGARAGMTDEMYLNGIHACVNSKMVREGYVGDWTQSFADLFPLCELTPASRPLLLPVFKKPEKDVMRLPQRAYDVFNNVIVPDFNLKFRAFYDALIPTLYGQVIWVG